MMASLRARIVVALVVLVCAGAATVSCSNKIVALDPGTGNPEPLCPQVALIAFSPPLFATGGVEGFPSCGGFGGSMTYPALNPPSDVSVLVTTNVDPANTGCTPTPNQVLWVVGLRPVANFAFMSAPTLTFVPPASSINTSFTYYYCVKDQTAGIPASPVSQAGVIVNNSTDVVFPSLGSWGPFTANHDYRIQFYRV
jgi:hypothetical protein